MINSRLISLIIALFLIAALLIWYSANIVLMHAVLESKLRREISFPIGSLLLTIIPLIVVFVLLILRKTISQIVYVAFVVFAIFLRYGNMTMSDFTSISTAIGFDLLILLTPLPFMVLALKDRS